MRFPTRWLRPRPASAPGADRELLDLFRRDPGAAWPLFLDRYAGRILGWLGAFGLDYDEAMERFVFVCEKLAEDRCRRLRSVERLGADGELVPWLREVVRNLVVSWVRSVEGRRRLFRAIEALDPFDQEVFRLHWWDGLRPSEVGERLRAEGRTATPARILEALARIEAALDAAGRWRLISQLGRGVDPVSLEHRSEALGWEPAAPVESPEHAALRSEERRWLAEALDDLGSEERLAVQLRFWERLEYREIGDLLGCDPSTARRRIARSVERLGAIYEDRSAITPGEALAAGGGT